MEGIDWKKFLYAVVFFFFVLLFAILIIKPEKPTIIDGQEVSVYDPILKENVPRTEFNWMFYVVVGFGFIFSLLILVYVETTENVYMLNPIDVLNNIPKNIIDALDLRIQFDGEKDLANSILGIWCDEPYYIFKVKTKSGSREYIKCYGRNDLCRKEGYQQPVVALEREDTIPKRYISKTIHKKQRETRITYENLREKITKKKREEEALEELYGEEGW